jgi:hypothetical protein
VRRNEFRPSFLGELRSMAPALAGSKGLFGPLQNALLPNKPRIHLTKDTHVFLDDFRWLAHNFRNRPTRLAHNFRNRPTRLFDLAPSPLGHRGNRCQWYRPGRSFFRSHRSAFRNRPIVPRVRVAIPSPRQHQVTADLYQQPYRHNHQQ